MYVYVYLYMSVRLSVHLSVYPPFQRQKKVDTVRALMPKASSSGEIV